MTRVLTRPWSRALAALCALALCILSAPGCSGDGGGGLPVSGRVSVEGNDLPKGSISFWADGGSASKPVATGTIENGKYTLYSNGKAGAPAGKYKVSITAQQEQDSTKATSETKPLVNPIYSDKDKSGLKAEVSASPKEGAYDFRLSK